MFVRGQLTQRKVDDEIWLKDKASIFNINVTNVKEVGASACIPCPVSDKKEYSLRTKLVQKKYLI